jgi:putative membrane protein
VRTTSVLFAADPELTKVFARWVVALPPAIMNALRGHRGIGPAAGLPRDEVEAILASAHPPLHVCRRLTQLVADARGKGLITDIQQTSLDATIGLLVDYFGACERIVKTPLPFAYVVHLRRALILFCFSVPFVIVKDFGWGAIGVTILVAYIFFGIEEIGVEIENPFGSDDNDLPLEDICAGITRSSLSLVPGAQLDPASPP